MNQRYTNTAIFLHWTLAAGLIGTFALGFYMEGLSFSPFKLQLYAWHKWAGITVLGLAVLRLLWRLTHRAPALPSAMSSMSRLLAHVGHGALYILMLVIPLSGWLMSSAKGVPVVLFGIWPLPDLVGKDPGLGDTLQTVHMALNYSLAAVVVGHVTAALLHHFVMKDGVLLRMLPQRRA